MRDALFAKLALQPCEDQGLDDALWQRRTVGRRADMAGAGVAAASHLDRRTAGLGAGAEAFSPRHHQAVTAARAVPQQHLWLLAASERPSAANT